MFLGATHNFLSNGVNRYHRTVEATKVNRRSLGGVMGGKTCYGQLSHPGGELKENPCSLKSSEIA